MMHGETEEPAVPDGRVNILFCPFCGESFEGRLECPEHELELVPIDRLPRVDRCNNGVSYFADPRLGRGPILFGAALTVVGFLLPLVRTSSTEASALEVAIDGAHNLWLAPGAAIGMLAVLWFRRDRESMWSARLAVLGLAIAGALPISYTTYRIARMADASQTEVEWLAGAAVMSLGLVVAALGSFRFGRPRRR
jgi:hypothetical protein